MQGMKNYLKYNPLLTEVEKELINIFSGIDRTVLTNQARVLAAFQQNQVDETCFYESTGYGYHDFGREKLDQVFAEIFGAEAGLVRPQFVSGTHAIACCLYGVLKPDSRLVSLTGRPYDTLQKALGLSVDIHGTLHSLNIRYSEADFTNELNHDVLDSVLADDTQVVFLQRSRGYAVRRSLTREDIENIIGAVKNKRPDVIIFVDNCYGEFVSSQEPCHVGADLIAGSLIKNPGGGLAPTGGYVAGRRGLVEAAANRLTAPGIAGEVGPTLSWQRLLLQGLFLAPGMVCQSLKGMVFASKLFQHLGFEVEPAWDGPRTDIIQAITLGSPERLVGFCRGIQSRSPVDSHVRPEPWNMPGYGDQVVMAAGTFVQGASLELTADAPLRNPYTVFLQGGLSYHHVKLAVLAAAQEVIGIG